MMMEDFEQQVTLMKNLKYRKHVDYLLNHYRELVFADGRGEYYYVVRVIDEHVRDFLKENCTEIDTRFPAIDLASGPCAYTVAFAERYHEPKFIGLEEFPGGLDWYPTERVLMNEGVDYLEIETKTVLRFLSSDTSPVCGDAKGTALFIGDMVRIDGLQAKPFYNGYVGIVTERVTTSSGEIRVGVTIRVDDDRTRLSLKPSNLERAGAAMGDPEDKLAIPLEEVNERPPKLHSICSGMLERACILDILRKETWSNLEAVTGRCALVTCTNLLTCIGYRAPTVWKDCLGLASRLLAPGGSLVTFDCTDYGGYGDLKEMIEYIKVSALPLQPSIVGEIIEPHRFKMRLISWKKTRENA